MLVKIKYFLSLIYILLLGCAAQGPASGGPADKDGPILLSIHPENKSVNILDEQSITLQFDEMLDPSSILSSITIKPELNYKIKVKSRKIIINPEPNWPPNKIIRINLSRKIKDYQKNMMSKPIQFIYSTGIDIPDGIINGKIIGNSSNNLIEVGLFQWPITDSSKLIQKVEVNESNYFKFIGIEKGIYTVIAIEGGIFDVKKDVRKKNYAMLTENYITINSINNSDYVELLLSKPIERLSIISNEMQSQYFSKITMSDNTSEFIVIDTLLKPGDSVHIDIEKNNQLELYHIPQFTFILPEIIDTIPPKLLESNLNKDLLKVSFSEPIYIDNNAIFFNKDSLEIMLPFYLDNAYTIAIPNITEEMNEYQFYGSNIKDWSGNIFKDSIKVIKINRTINKKTKKNGGNIIGSVNYEGIYPIIIEAHEINSKEYFYTDETNLNFNFINLPPGSYEIWGYEALNKIDKNIYHSGIWIPYQRAAKFTFYADTIDVRSKWDIENININFK